MRDTAYPSAQPECRIEGRLIELTCFEQLRNATPTSDSEIIQVENGAMRGVLRHATVGDLSLGLGSFSQGLISQGIYSNERVTIGMLFRYAPDRIVPELAGDIRVWAPGAEHQTRYLSGASFGGISVTAREMARFFGSNSRLGSMDAWRRCGSLRMQAAHGGQIAEALSSIAARMNGSHPVTEREADFWKDSIIDALTQGLQRAELETAYVPSATKLVRRIQDYLESNALHPIHISRLLAEFNVSRRSLHRAFVDVLGVAPIMYLRQKRLCQARRQLKATASSSATISDVAFRNGFADFGRFAGYYKRLFDEYPSQTVARARLHS